MSKISVQHKGKDYDIDYDIKDIPDERKGRAITATIADPDLQDLVGERLTGNLWQRDNGFESAGLKDETANRLKNEIFVQIFKAEKIDFPLL
jgi:hypothetical protein